MKLYYKPGACSLSPHIALRELGYGFELEKVDLATKQTETGADFTKVNPKGYVPALEIAPGDVLTENLAILTWLSDNKPGNSMTPARDSRDFYRMLEWESFVTSEMHKGFGALLAGPNPKGQEKLEKRLQFLDEALAGKTYLLGDTFSMPDCYLFTVLTWADRVNVELPANVKAYRDRVAQRPKVKEAMQAEGLLQTQTA